MTRGRVRKIDDMGGATERHNERGEEYIEIETLI